MSHRMSNIVSWLFLLPSLLAGSPAFADATSFDPTTVTVEAKSSGGVPVGTIIAWPVATNPEDMDNWLECNGQSVDKTAFPELFAVVGSNVPDLRGLFLRGHGSQPYTQNNGVNVGVTTTLYESGALGIIQGDGMRAGGGAKGHIYSYAGGAHCRMLSGDGIFRNIGGGSGRAKYSGGSTGSVGGTLEFSMANIMPSANEIRPVNMAVRYLIRALP